ncbi:MAG: hypothetical protein Q9227_008026 [Pyrenula ochraceoflavens]
MSASKRQKSTPNSTSPQTSSNDPPSLPLPAHTLASLTPLPYLHAHLQSSPSPIRPSLRAPQTPRPLSLNLHPLTHPHGSSLVRLGSTTAICGVRGEILDVRNIPSYRIKSQQNPPSHNDRQDPEDEKEENDSPIWTHNLLVPNLDLSSGCTPSNPPSQPPSGYAQSLSHRLLTLLRTTHLIPLSSLEIYGPSPSSDQSPEEAEAGEKGELKAYWTLYIDLLILSLDGSAFDAAWLALYAALKDTVLPDARWDADLDTVICDPRVERGRKLGESVKGMPVPVSFVGVAAEEEGKGRGKGKGKGWVLVDPDAFEEGVCAEEGCVVVDRDSGSNPDPDSDSDSTSDSDEDQHAAWKILHLSKAGGSVIGTAELEEVIRIAGERWKEWRSVLGAHMKHSG